MRTLALVILAALLPGCAPRPTQTITFEWRDFPPLELMTVIEYREPTELVTNYNFLGGVIEDLSRHGWRYQGSAGATVIMESRHGAQKFYVHRLTPDRFRETYR